VSVSDSGCVDYLFSTGGPVRKSIYMQLYVIDTCCLN